MVLESLGTHSFLVLSWRESLWPDSGMIHRSTGSWEETPLLTAHQPVSWSSPGLTSCRLHRVSQDEIDEVDGLVYWFLLVGSMLTAQLSHAGKSSFW